MKITILQAGIIIKLSDIPKPLRNPMDLAMMFERDYKYMCEQLRLMKRRGLIKEHIRGRRKYYDIFDKNALDLAKKRLNPEFLPEKEEKSTKKEGKK